MGNVGGVGQKGGRVEGSCHKKQMWYVIRSETVGPH